MGKFRHLTKYVKVLYNINRRHNLVPTLSEVSMSNFFAAVFGILGILVLTGGDQAGASLTRTAIAGACLLLAAAIAYQWEGIIDALFGDHRQVVVGRDAKWVPPNRRKELHEPPAGLFDSYPIRFGFERENNPLVVNGRPFLGIPVSDENESVPEFFRTPRRRADGRPVAVRRSSNDRRPIVPRRN